jgi:hypothetical protein
MRIAPLLALLFCAAATAFGQDVAKVNPAFIKPAELPPGIKLIPRINLTVVTDSTGYYTIIPKASVLRIDDKGPYAQPAGMALDPAKFLKFTEFYARHQSTIALITAQPQPGDAFNLVVYDDLVTSTPPAMALVLAVNDQNVPISFFEHHAGLPMEAASR